MIEIRLVGSIDVRGNDGREVAAILAQPKRLALLVYLAAARPRGFHRRDKLVALLWPEFDASRARQALNKTVYHLRRVLGEGAILSRGDQELSIDESVIRCDVRVFDDAVAAGRLEDALEQYRGDFADGLFVDEAPEFEQWVSGERHRLQTAAAKAAGSLADGQVNADLPAAVEWARRALSLSPFDEPAVRRVMTLLEQQGDRAGAALVYDEFARKLMDELGLVPSPQTTSLRDALVSGTAAPRPPSAPPDLEPAPPPHVSTRESASRRAPRRTAFVVAAVAAVAASVAAAMLFRGAPRTSTPISLDDKRVFVDVLENRTADSTLNLLGPMAADWITQGLTSAEIVRVVDSRNALVLSGRGGRSARELARESGAGLVISGAYYRQSDSIRFQVQLTDVVKNEVVRAFQPVIVSAARPMEALEGLRQQALSIVAQTAAPFAAVVRTTARAPLYSAYREYMEGVDLYVHRDQDRAYGHFIRAAQLDTTFTVALLSAASLAQVVGARSADSIVTKLSSQRDSLSPTSRLWLDAMVATQRGDVHEASRLFGDLSHAVPEAGFQYMYMMSLFIAGRAREAAAVARGVDPGRGWMNGFYSYWVARAMLDHVLDDRAAEEADVVAAERQYPRNMAVATARARLIASGRSRKQLDSLLDEVVSNPAVPGWDAGSVMAVAALEAASHGRADWLPAIRERALRWYGAIPANERERETGRFGFVWMLHSVGAWPELEARVARLSREAPNDLRWVAMRGIVSAHSRDTIAARQIDAELARAVEASPGPNRNRRLLYMDRARIAAMLGERDSAVELLRQALAAGAPFTVYLHTEPAFASLREYAPFTRLIAPKD